MLVLALAPLRAQAGPDAGVPETAQEAPASKPPIGLGGVELEELENGTSPTVERLVVPPYYQEDAGPVHLKLVLPLFFFRERTGKGARTDLGLLPFYWRYREGAAKTDVYFPFYWRFRDPSFDTDIVLQTYWNRSSHGYNFGFGPLVFAGKDTRDSSSYQVVPPLFWRLTEGKWSFLLAGLYYDRTNGEDYDLGLPPVFFAGKEHDETYLVVLPPLFWRFTDEVAYETTTIVPPFFYKTRETGWSFGALPIFYLARDQKWARTMVLPFYYGSRWGEGRSHYLPFLLSYYRYAPGFSQGGSMIFYHWYWNQGDYMKVITPLLWLWGNERTDDNRVLVPPLVYRRWSPARSDVMAGLVYWDFEEFHRERTFAIMPLFAHNWSMYEDRWRTWIAPSFDFGEQPDGYHVRLHPLFYRAKDSVGDHLVVAPVLWHFETREDDNTVVFPIWWQFEDLQHKSMSRVTFPIWWQFDTPRRGDYARVAFPLWWDFEDGREQSRTTVVPPLVWRDRDPRSTMTGFLNFVWHEGQIKGNPFWTFQMFPFLAFGHPAAPDGAYWSFLSGFLGWRRQGSTKELKLLWIPIDLSD
jgi:hypothetical protein